MPFVGESRPTLDHVGPDANLLALDSKLHGRKLQDTHRVDPGSDRRNGVR